MRVKEVGIKNKQASVKAAKASEERREQKTLVEAENPEPMEQEITLN